MNKIRITRLSSVKLSDDETVVKDYHAANIKKPSKGEAHVILTNKRVIINYQTSQNNLTNDVHIKEVRGADVSWSTANRRKLGISIAVIGIIILTSGISASSSPFGGSQAMIPMLSIAIPLMAMGAYYIFKSKTTFVIKIHTKAISENLFIHNISNSFLERGLERGGSISMDGTAGPDAKTMANEIGVIILDIQKKAKTDTEVL